MNVKISKILLAIFAILTLTACSCPKPKPIFIDRPVEVKIPIKCKRPNVECSFDKPTDTEVISSLVECLIDVKRASDVCE